jgi:hypothetical protein
MPEPYRMAVLVAGWCAPRFGEIAELRRRDVSVDSGLTQLTHGLPWG